MGMTCSNRPHHFHNNRVSIEMATKNNTPKPELLPCPFCGSDAELYEGYRGIYDYPTEGSIFYQAEIRAMCTNGSCMSSGAQQGASTPDINGEPDKNRDDVIRAKELAIERWNRRA